MERSGDSWQYSECKSVDHDWLPLRHSCQELRRSSPIGCVGTLISFAKIDYVDGPAECLEFGDYAPVISIAARGRREIAGHGEREPFHRNDTSYHARATCDSEIVTRIAASSRSARPSLPARAASANPS